MHDTVSTKNYVILLLLMSYLNHKRKYLHILKLLYLQLNFYNQEANVNHTKSLQISILT